MAKRFTDTDKWKKPFIRKLQTPYKILWLYILDECDHAGVWQVDFEVARLKTGEPEINEEDALIAFSGRVLVNEDKWFINDFVEFQYGELNPDNRVHKSVIDIINKFKNKPLTSPLKGAKDKDKDKYMDKDKDGKWDKYLKTLPVEVIPNGFTECIMQWLKYKAERKEAYTPTGFEKMVTRLISMSENKVDLAVKILDDAMSKNYAGFFEVKEEQKQNTKQQPKAPYYKNL